MVSITFPIKPEILSQVEHFPWINWSELAREEILRKEIFKRYMKTNKITKEDQEFCEEIDWHPVDELPLREDYIKKLQKIAKEPSGRSMTIEEFNKWCESL